MEESSPPGQSTSAHFDLRTFGKDTIVYTTGQGLLLLFGFVQILIVAKYLSTEDYGYWQLFRLYSSYFGLLHLGFIDGLLVRWAGKELHRLGSEIGMAITFLTCELLLVILPLALALCLLTGPPLKFIALMILVNAFIMCLFTFFKFAAQAARKFRLLTAIEVGRGFLFIIIVVLLFAFNCMEYQFIIIAFLASFVVAFFVLAFQFRKYLRWRPYPSLWAYGRENINIGIFVLLGNLIIMLFLTIDRLMVSAIFTIEQFATYAFAIMITVVVYTLVNAISQVFFPNLSAMTNEFQLWAYRTGKQTIILCWAAILVLYFPISEVVDIFVSRYIESLPIMKILLCTVGFGSLIQILHVNYYKVHRMQRRYFFWGITALVISAILNLLAIKLFDTLESVAVATLIGFGIWYIINELNLKSVVKESTQQQGKHLLAICSYLGGFWFASLIVDWFVAQMFIYMGLLFLLTWVFFRQEVKELATMIRGYLN
ncbi:MAG: oligosaccharide flippase family protein [Planctomycetes bacterium]|nr:oligosaccharide flippase family protein [Planctomycetota bacterium]